MEKRFNEVLGWMFEAIAILLFPVSVLLTLITFSLPLNRINWNNTQKTPIVIHEHWLNKNYWHILMKKYLESKGYRVYWTNYSLLRGGVEEGAASLQRFMKKNDIHNAVVVAISFGSLSAYYYLEHLGGWERVNKFISVAGPFRGSPIAFLITFLKGGRQILPNNSYLKKITQDPKHPERILCLAAKRDEMVPGNSSILPNTRHKVIDATGHNVLHMFSEEVFEIVANEAK